MEDEDIVKLDTLTIGEKRKRVMSGNELEQREKRRKQHVEENDIDHNYTERNAMLRNAFFEGKFKREMQKRQRDEPLHSDGVTKLDDDDDI